MSKTEKEKEKQERGYSGSLLETAALCAGSEVFSSLFLDD